VAAKLGLISGDSADAVADAYREYRRRQHWLRLNGAKYARVPAERCNTTSTRRARCGGGCSGGSDCSPPCLMNAVK